MHSKASRKRWGNTSSLLIILFICLFQRKTYLDDSSSTSSEEEYEDGNEVGYASEPSAGILDHVSTFITTRKN